MNPTYCVTLKGKKSAWRCWGKKKGGGGCAKRLREDYPRGSGGRSERVNRLKEEGRRERAVVEIRGEGRDVVREGGGGGGGGKK